MKINYPRLLAYEEVDSAMDEWYNDDSINCEIYEYLGWTWAEYVRYVAIGELPKADKYK
jgi:hypothetical protein